MGLEARGVRSDFGRLSMTWSNLHPFHSCIIFLQVRLAGVSFLLLLFLVHSLWRTRDSNAPSWPVLCFLFFSVGCDWSCERCALCASKVSGMPVSPIDGRVTVHFVLCVWAWPSIDCWLTVSSLRILRGLASSCRSYDPRSSTLTLISLDLGSTGSQWWHFNFFSSSRPALYINGDDEEVVRWAGTEKRSESHHVMTQHVHIHSQPLVSSLSCLWWLAGNCMDMVSPLISFLMTCCQTIDGGVRFTFLSSPSICPLTTISSFRLQRA